MTESELERAVVGLLKHYALYGYHTHDSRRSVGGFPDWVIIGEVVLYRELKTQDGTLSPSQSRVRNLLLAAGCDWSLWRPSDLHSGRIERELGAIA